LIAGAGPVGLTTALLLARWQIPTIVFEAADAATKQAPTGSRAICFQRDVLDVFDRVGSGDEMVAEGVTWSTGRTYYRERELFAVGFPASAAQGRPPWINISQSRVESLLLASAAAEPLVDVRFDEQVTSVTEHSGGSGIEVEVTSAGGARSRVRGGYLVGADGSRSAIRQSLGIGFDGRSYEDQFLICDIRADLPFPSERRFFFDPSWNPDRQVLVHPCPDGVWRIDWQVPADFDLAAERASGGLDARVRQITGDAAYEIVWATAYRFAERVAGAFVAGRAVLAGDAAHVYAPFGARGLNSGICDSENLAWKLAFIIRGWAPPALLDSYHAERHAAAAENLRVTSATMEFLVPQTARSRQRRAAALADALTDPQARSRIDSGKLAEPYWYTNSPLTTPGPSLDGFPLGPGALRPPVPGVLCPDGPCLIPLPFSPDQPSRPSQSPHGPAPHGSATRLRRLFGGSFVILTRRAADAAAAAQAARAAISGPVTAHSLDVIDHTGTLGQALDASDDSVHVVRPDGHLAAVLPRLELRGVAAAVRRATGHDEESAKLPAEAIRSISCL
jgi:2-polyprenyl-6-methoxyphenol hydroxylase-like FAD-dependent oxidoreductase